MNKLLTIGLAAAALASGVAATSGAAQAADWNNGGYYGHDRYDDHARYDNRDRNDWRGDRNEWRGDRRDGWRSGYRYRQVCRSYRSWSPYYGRYITRTRC